MKKQDRQIRDWMETCVDVRRACGKSIPNMTKLAEIACEAFDLFNDDWSIPEVFFEMSYEVLNEIRS